MHGGAHRGRPRLPDVIRDPAAPADPNLPAGGGDCPDRTGLGPRRRQVGGAEVAHRCGDHWCGSHRKRSGRCPAVGGRTRRDLWRAVRWQACVVGAGSPCRRESVGGAAAVWTRESRHGRPAPGVVVDGVARLPVPAPADDGGAGAVGRGHRSPPGDGAWARRGVRDHRDVGVHHQVETPRAGHHLSSSVTTVLPASPHGSGVTQVCADICDVAVSDVAVLTSGY